uniref:Uncharacterized protein n=1 Tax=Arundo donax TaxID=35708 RepID=A0A0A9FMS9_ARUDO
MRSQGLFALSLSPFSSQNDTCSPGHRFSCCRTCFEKDGMKGSSKQASKYTSPTEVFITVAQLAGSCL